ncbi:serine/threonine protein kinase [Cystobacter fuscus]|uniref:serine/threonine-protein kinase n=1 Tax=Cystobacter fuscus TaxID=43 RepID=UPI002B3237C2|nr:serine/threonine protein kinase [Cystobacter fuscus]
MAHSVIDSICPEEPLVREVASGRFPEAEVARLFAHAENCPACGRLLMRSGGFEATGEVPTHVVPPPTTPSSPAPEEVLPRGATVGRYMVLEKLGAGGMGVVYAAYDPELNRRLALKLLHAGSDQVERSGGQARLLREAQALARLSHPHVTSIYDVGTWEERVFIAMELVEGPSLRDWLKQGPRPWREVVEVFIAAGRGLAAAHAAGLVHRDFKPDNVLLGKDGRVRVLDFGLARQVSATTPGEVEEALSPPPVDVPWSELGQSPLNTPLTRAGLVIGTLAYMAPESYEGIFDARADQFSYCVTLYELLYGERPHGKTPGPPSTWRAPEPPRDARVPANVRRIVLRGLALEPEQRWPSMDALLGALGDTLPRRQRQWLAVGGLLALSLGVGLPLQLRSTAEPPCQGGARHLEGLWDGARKAALGQAFQATGKPNAGESWSRTAQVLDTYAGDWEAMHVEACEATRVRGAQSDAVLSLRMACLERRLQSLRALTDVYAHPDAALVDQAAKAASALPLVAGCANVEALQAPVLPPEDAATRQKVERLEVRLAEARALFDSGQFKPALERTRTLADDALALHYRPLQAEVLELRGALEEKAGDVVASEASLRQAVWAAEAGRHDEVIASASARLVRSAMLQAHFEQGREWAEHTRAVLERLGGDARIEAFVTNALGAIFMREDKTTEALENFRQVVALRQKVYSTEHPEVAAAYNNLGAALTKAGRLSEAREALSHAQRLYAKTLGPHHLETGNALHNLGILAQKTADEAAAVVYFQGALEAREVGSQRETLDVAMTYATLGASYCHLHDYARCLSAYERALRIRREILGSHHTDVAASLEDVAQVLLALGRPGEALEHYQLALRTVEAAKEQVPYQLVIPLNGMGEVLLAQGKRAEALPYLQRALALAEKSEVEDVWVLATVLETMGDWHLKGGQYRQALPFYQRALALEEKRVPARHPDLFGPLVGVGECQLALHAPAAARSTLERALATEPLSRISTPAVADARFLLARAVWEGGDAARARELALSAQKALLQEHKDSEASQVTAWLDSHAEH